MSVILEDWIAQYIHLKPTCEKILQRRISPSTWANWERLVGACYAQGKRLKKRKYTDEQTRLFLCLAWMRRQKMGKITYSSLRVYHTSNDYKIEEVFAAIINGEVPPKEPETKLIPLSQVKLCCEEIWGSELSPDCWYTWRKHLGLINTQVAEEGAAALLVFIACWRKDNPRQKLPSVKRLTLMMGDRSCAAMTLDTASSSVQFHQWQMTGCSGKELPKYLAACGYRVGVWALYKWGGFSQRQHYSVSELAQWRQKAEEMRIKTRRIAS